MLSFLNEAAQNTTQWILPVILVVMVAVLFVTNMMRNKKAQESAKEVLNSLQVGTKVKTYSGIYGTIIEISETTDGKIAVLETGSEKNKGFISIDMNAIYGIDKKEDVVLDVNGNPIIASEVQEQAPVVEEEVSEKQEVEVEVAEKKEPKKSAPKKSNNVSEKSAKAKSNSDKSAKKTTSKPKAKISE